LERSLAVKCPSVNYFLAGTKRVQQRLAQPGCLQRWLTDSEAKEISQTFAGLYSFEVVSISYAPMYSILSPNRQSVISKHAEKIAQTCNTRRSIDTSMINCDKISVLGNSKVVYAETWSVMYSRAALLRCQQGTRFTHDWIESKTTLKYSRL